MVLVLAIVSFGISSALLHFGVYLMYYITINDFYFTSSVLAFKAILHICTTHINDYIKSLILLLGKKKHSHCLVFINILSLVHNKCMQISISLYIDLVISLCTEIVNITLVYLSQCFFSSGVLSISFITEIRSYHFVDQ